MKIQSLIFITFVLFSCKQNTNSTGGSVSESSPKETYLLLNQGDVADAEIQSMRAEAIKVLEHRQKESDNKVITILEKDIFVFDAVVMGSDMKMGDSIAGEWLDYKDDLTYEYGKFDQVNGGGRYFYNFDESTLLMIDNNAAMKPQEFETKHANDVMILIGKPLYRDNNIQTKLNLVASKPSKSAQAAPSN
jgi:hypothetical protein